MLLQVGMFCLAHQYTQAFPRPANSSFLGLVQGGKTSWEGAGLSTLSSWSKFKLGPHTPLNLSMGLPGLLKRTRVDALGTREDCVMCD